MPRFPGQFPPGRKRCWSSTPWSSVRPTPEAGAARRFVAFAEELAKSQGCKVIRLDTYEGNEPAKAFYPKLGYRYAGLTEFFFEQVIWENLVCYEKAVF